MPTPDGVVLFPQSRADIMHFRSQPELAVRSDGNVLEIKAFAVSSRRLDGSRGTPERPSS